MTKKKLIHLAIGEVGIIIIASILGLAPTIWLSAHVTDSWILTIPVWYVAYRIISDPLLKWYHRNSFKDGDFKDVT